MKTPNLPLGDIPTKPRVNEVEEFKKLHDIETHRSDIGTKDPWCACYMPAARAFDESITDIGDAAAKACRILDEQGYLVTGKTERDAIRNLCANKRINIHCTI